MGKNIIHSITKLMGQLLSFVLTFVILNLYVFWGTTPLAMAQSVVKYGQEYHIKNSYSGGSYLDTCGGGGSCSSTTRWNVMTSTKKDRDGVGTGKWIIESAKGKAYGSIVQVGDVVYIKNVYSGGSYLDTCGSAKCQASTRWSVTTNTKKDRAGVGTGKWIIESAKRRTNGSSVFENEELYLNNMYSGGSYLDSCGHGGTCSSSTRFGVVTDTKRDREGVGTGKWSFENAAIPSSLYGQNYLANNDEMERLLMYKNPDPAYHKWYVNKHPKQAAPYLGNHIQGMAMMEGERHLFTHSMHNGQSYSSTNRSRLIVAGKKGIFSNFKIPAESTTEASGLQACGNLVAVAWDGIVRFYYVAPDVNSIVELRDWKLPKPATMGGGSFGNVAFVYHDGYYYLAAGLGNRPDRLVIYRKRVNNGKIASSWELLSFNHWKETIGGSSGLEHGDGILATKHDINALAFIATKNKRLYLLSLQHDGEHNQIAAYWNNYLGVSRIYPPESNPVSPNKVGIENYGTRRLEISDRLYTNVKGDRRDHMQVPSLRWAGAAYVTSKGAINVYASGRNIMYGILSPPKVDYAYYFRWVPGQ